MSIISPEDLEASPLADLHALASALGIDGYRRLRKEDLVDAILARQGAAPAPRRRRAGAVTPAVTPALSDDVASEEEDEEDTTPQGERPARSGRSRRRRGRGRDGEAAADTPQEAPQAHAAEPEERVAEGVVELLPNGSGFLRVNASETSDEDVYISAAQARRCELVSGDRIAGPVRPARRSERHPSLVRIDTINGVAAEDAVVGTRIEDLEVDFPTVALALGADPALAAVAATTPFGLGSRVLIVGPTRSGRSELLRRLFAAVAANEGVEVELLAVGVRPEELSQWKETPGATSSGLSFAASADAQEAAVEQAAERGRRIAVRGGNAVLLIDTLDGLGAGAVRRTLAAARNLRGAGSLTVLATARAPVGGETTLIALSAEGEFPAIDPAQSGTLRAELLEAPPKPKAVRVRKPRAPRRAAAAAAQPEAGSEPPAGGGAGGEPLAGGEPPADGEPQSGGEPQALAAGEPEAPGAEAIDSPEPAGDAAADAQGEDSDD
jgi:transcription termination factor Rho